MLQIIESPLFRTWIARESFQRSRKDERMSFATREEPQKRNQESLTYTSWGALGLDVLRMVQQNRNCRQKDEMMLAIHG